MGFKIKRKIKRGGLIGRRKRENDFFNRFRKGRIPFKHILFAI